MLAPKVSTSGDQAIVAVYSSVAAIVSTGVAPFTGAVTPAMAAVAIATSST